MQSNNDTEHQVRDMIEPELEPGEQILWVGRPKPGVTLAPIDILAFLLGFYMVSIPIREHIFSSPTRGVSGHELINVFGIIFGSIYIFIGLYVAFGRHVKSILWKRSACYALTNVRAIVLSAYRGKKVNAFRFHTDTTFDTHIRRDGSGWIDFGDPEDIGSGRSRKFTSIFGQWPGHDVVFIDIPDVAKAAAIAREVITGKSPEAEVISAETREQTSPAIPYPFLRSQRTISPLGKLRLVFGNAGTFPAWFWLGISMVFFWKMSAVADFTPLYFWTGTKTAPGRVISVTDEGWTVSQSKGAPGVPVYSNTYVFTASGGHTYQAKTATLGQHVREGDPCTIVYWTLWPAKSQIQGIPNGALPWYLGFFPFIFIVIGVAFSVASIEGGRNAIRLLENGKPAYATLKSKRVTRGKTTRYTLEYEFKADDGQTYTVEQTVTDPTPLTDQKHELVLYNPSNYKLAELVDAIIGNPTIDDNGTVHIKRTWLGILGLIFALAVIAVHVWMGWGVWGR